jgi:hypothetical protein
VLCSSLDCRALVSGLPSTSRRLCVDGVLKVNARKLIFHASSSSLIRGSTSLELNDHVGDSELLMTSASSLIGEA